MRGRCNAHGTLMPVCKSKSKALTASLTRWGGGQQCCTMPELFWNRVYWNYTHGFSSACCKIPMSIHAPKHGHKRGASTFLGEKREDQEAVCCGKDGLQKRNQSRSSFPYPEGKHLGSISFWNIAAVMLSWSSCPDPGYREGRETLLDHFRGMPLNSVTMTNQKRHFTLKSTWRALGRESMCTAIAMLVGTKI